MQLPALLNCMLTVRTLNASADCDEKLHQYFEDGLDLSDVEVFRAWMR